MDQLIFVLCAVLFIALIGYGLYMVCTKFFPEFPPARWICGVILLILILAFVSGQLSWPFHRV